jgi:hypothetical protein
MATKTPIIAEEGMTLALDLTPEAVRQFPDALHIARLLEDDQASLEPVRVYLINKHGLDPESAEASLRAYLKYFLMVTVTNEKLAPSEEADLAWHAHILHTQIYAPWCHRHFGRFIHHVPSSPDVHPPAEFFIKQNQLGKTFYGQRTIYVPFSASHHCSNSHGCTHGCSHCAGTG